MATLSFVVGIIGNIISLLVFASPIKTFGQVVKKKSTENYKGAPYIATFLCTSLWTLYGVLKQGGFLIATVNGAGAVFQCIYIFIFLIYSPPDKKVKTAKLVAILDVGFLGAVISVTLFALHGTIQLTFLGILCTALTILMYASPLLAMKTVIKTKSVEYMPFLLSFFLFMNAGAWAIYAVLVKDFYIAIPNMIGLLLGSAQLVVYVMYKKEGVRGKGSSEGKDGEEGSLKDIEIANGDVKVMKAVKRVKSLPNPTLDPPHPHTVRRVLKTLSFGAYNLPSTWANQEQLHHDDVDLDNSADPDPEGHRPSPLSFTPRCSIAHLLSPCTI